MMNPYEETWHMMQSTHAAILRICKDPRVQQLIVENDKAVADVFERYGEVVPFPQKEQKKPPVTTITSGA